MPYQSGSRLPGEKASKLGHLEVLKSDLVNKLCSNFELPTKDEDITSQELLWQPYPTGHEPLPIIFGVDGSIQTIKGDSIPRKEMSFIKTALLRLDQQALAKIDKNNPHPFALKKIMTDAALYHATVLPLKNVRVPGVSVLDSVREVIFESMKDESLNGEPLETLKWLVYEKWDGQEKSIPPFKCPHCPSQAATLPYDAEKGNCTSCGGELLITDMLGFHQDMAEEFAPETVGTSYMLIHETMLLFTGIRLYWESNREILNDCLFIKDGPLSIRAQYSKLVAPIRRFFAFAKSEGITVHLMGQEKTGRFVDFLDLSYRNAPVGSIFIPGDKFIKEEVQHRPEDGAAYGIDTNYGSKVFMKIDDYHHMVLSIPTGTFTPNPTLDDLIGADRIFSTLPTILSSRFEGALLPIELANGVASLSTYPSARILHIFADSFDRK